MFGKKKKTENIVTPEEVADLGFKDEVKAAKDKKSDVYDHFHAQENARKVAGAKKRRRRYAVAFSVLVGVLLILYIISMLLTQWGDLTISIGDLQDGKTIMLSEDPDFGDAHVKLNGGKVEKVTNITKSWLPKDLDSNGKGAHNGDNYIAYTFYMRNTGTEQLDYECEMNITGVAKSADEAVRIMIYKNGEEAVYAKGQFKDRSKAETDATKWVNEDTVVKFTQKDFKSGTTDKYTIVVWTEGNDPQCVDSIRGGHVRMRMIFNVLKDEAESN